MRLSAVFAVVILTAPSGAESATVLEGGLRRSASLPFRIGAAEPGPHIRVDRLDRDSAAAHAGLAEGDVILAVDGHEYRRRLEGVRLMSHGRGGMPVELRVERDGQVKTIRYVATPARLEDYPGRTTVYGVLETPEGRHLRTIGVYPDDIPAPLPAVYFVQWLSCDSVDGPVATDDDGWEAMLSAIASRLNAVFVRTEKAGVGDSDGECWTLDYETELAHHRQAIRKLLNDSRVDPAQIVLYGGSSGGSMAALLAAEFQPAGLIIWGTAIKSWFEHLLEFNRRHLEYSGVPASAIKPRMDRLILYLTEYLVRQRSPAQILREDPDLAPTWFEIRGTASDTHYGRPPAYHIQAHQADWAGALGKLRSPTLVLYGEYDWFEELDDHELIARMVNRNRPGAAEFHVLPRIDHHFSAYPDRQAAYDAEGGKIAVGPAVERILAWFERTIIDGGTR